MNNAEGPPVSPGPPDEQAQAQHRLSADRPMMITDSMLAQKRADFERGMRMGPPLTLSLMLSLVVVFIWQLATGSLESREAIIGSGALVRDRVLAGEVWRMLSAAFLHGGPDHLFGNMVSLYILGLACEHAVGSSGMATIYLLSALGGSGVSMLLSPGPGVGASGAIFGLMGAIVLILHRERARIYVRDKRIGVVIAVWAGYTLLTGALSPVVDNGAHLGGLLAGALAASAVRFRLEPTA